jgi:hypothetical protein
VVVILLKRFSRPCPSFRVQGGLVSWLLAAISCFLFLISYLVFLVALDHRFFGCRGREAILSKGVVVRHMNHWQQAADL